MPSTSLPRYSTSPAPSYASLPSFREETLAYSPRTSRSASPFTGKFIKQWRSVTLILKDQDSTTETPIYSRNSIIRGEIGLNDCENVLSVVVQLDGLMCLASSEGGSSATVLAANKHTLWERHNSQTEKCPTLMPFSLQFPSTYTYEDQTRKLPPSFEAIFLDTSSVFVKCTYNLTIVITKLRHRRLSFLTTSKPRRIRINYYPRSRPNRPILPINPLLSAVKSFPEECFQLNYTLKPRPRSSAQPLDCQFFIPSVQVFGLKDVIPFHIQISGPVSSLYAFFSSKSASSESTSASSSQNSGHTSQKPEKQVIRVCLIRIVHVRINGKRASRNLHIGEGIIRALPPPAPAIHDSDAGGQEETLDWEGEIKCNEDVASVGFSTPNLMVKDYIVLALRPPNLRTSPFSELEYLHPIKLVTDPWSDSEVHPDET